MAPTLEGIVDFVTSNLVIRDLSLTLNNSTTVDPDTAFRAEIACYSLPYGALGFISHILTYYTIFCLWAGSKPLWPWRSVSYKRTDFALGLISLTVSTTMAIITLVRCRHSWQLLTIGVWKLGVSLMNGFTAVTVAGVVIRGGAETEMGAYWMPLYLPAMVAGMAGLIDLVIQHWHIQGLRDLSYVMLALLSLMSLGSFFIGSGDEPDSDEKVFGTFFNVIIGSVAIFTFLSAFYSDWALGLMAGNLVGVPSKDQSVFYWTYWVAKRLTMLSF